MKCQEPPNKGAPQYHSRLTGVLSEVETRLQNAEALHPDIPAQSKADKETLGWDRLPPTAQRVILALSMDDGITITSVPPTSIHSSLNMRNVMEIQANCTLTYSGNNIFIFLPTTLCQALLQGHILVIPVLDAPAGLSLLLSPPSTAEPANDKKRAMRVQVLIIMVQDGIYKYEVGKLLNQHVHVVTKNQELRHSTRNFLRLTRDYLETEGPILREMATYNCHINCFRS